MVVVFPVSQRGFFSGASNGRRRHACTHSSSRLRGTPEFGCAVEIIEEMPFRSARIGHCCGIPISPSPNQSVKWNREVIVPLFRPDYRRVHGHCLLLLVPFNASLLRLRLLMSWSSKKGPDVLNTHVSVELNRSSKGLLHGRSITRPTCSRAGIFFFFPLE